MSFVPQFSLKAVAQNDAEAQEMYVAWRRLYKWWISAHYMFGILSVCFSGAVAAKLFTGQTASWMSLAAAICAGLVTFLGAQARARAYRRALSEVQTVVSQRSSTITPEEIRAAFLAADTKYLRDL